MDSVTLHEMENVAQGLGMPEISLGSGDIGNVVDIGDSSDVLGLDMLANPGRSRPSGAPQTYQVPTPAAPSGGMGLAEVEIGGGLDASEPITLNLGATDLGGSAPIEFEFKRAEADAAPFSSPSASASGGLFSNSQSATGPGINLATATVQRMDPQMEKEKKIEYLNKLQRLEQKGFPVSKRFTMDNSLDEMKMEFDRLVDARNLEASLRFQRQALMSVVTGLEWMNGRFDPFDLKLDGWSESVHENVEDFDEIFEELYDKYKDRGKMPPEARLVMALAGSGFMCHVSNTFLRSRMPSADDILKNNPDLARQFATAAAQQAGPGFGNFMNMAMGGPQGQGPQGAPVADPASGGASAGAFFGSSAERIAAQAQEAQARAQAASRFQQELRNGGTPMAQVPQSVAAMEPPRATARREMRGPSGVDDILQTFAAARQAESLEGTSMSQPPASPMTQPALSAAIELQSMASDDIGSAAESARTGTGRGRRRRAPVGNTLALNV